MSAIAPNAGSDCDFRIGWGRPEAPVDLTGWSVESYDVHPALAPFLTLNFEDRALGKIIGRIEWDESLKVGVPYHFRARIVNGANQRSSGRIIVRFK